MKTARSLGILTLSLFTLASCGTPPELMSHSLSTPPFVEESSDFFSTNPYSSENPSSSASSRSSTRSSSSSSTRSSSSSSTRSSSSSSSQPSSSSSSNSTQSSSSEEPPVSSSEEPVYSSEEPVYSSEEPVYSSEYPVESYESSADSSDWGTLDAPLSVDDAIALFELEPLATGVLSQKFTIRGVVARLKSTLIYLKCENSDKELCVDTFDLAEGIDTPLVNDIITVEGYGAARQVVPGGKISYLFTQKSTTERPLILRNERGVAPITLGEHEHLTISGIPESGMAHNGDQINLTIIPDEGYSVFRVRAGDRALELIDGYYSFVILGPTVITAQAVLGNWDVQELVFDFAQGPTWDRQSAIVDAPDTWKEQEAFGYVFNTVNVYSSGSYIMLYSKGKKVSPTLANLTPIPGAIIGVDFTVTTSASANGVYEYQLGTDAFTVPASSEVKHTGLGSFSIFSSPEEGFRYFAVSCTSSNYNGQIASIRISYVPDSTN